MPKIDALVSIVMPCYNLGVYLQEAIDSARNQTYRNIEIIIVDDGSTDEYTINILNQIKKNSPDIKVIFQKNAGPSGARNTGIKEAMGDYILCLDSDDILLPNYIENVLPTFYKDEKKEIGTEDYNPGKLLVENIVQGASIFRKEAWKKAGGYKTEMKGGYEDWEFWISIVESGYKWTLIPEIYFMYRIRDNSVSATASKKHLELYAKIISFHPKMFEKYASEFAYVALDIMNSLRSQYIANLNEVEETTKQNENLKKQIIELNKIKNNYDEIRFSRITKPWIILRSLIIKYKYRFFEIRNNFPVFLKKITPVFIKKIIKNNYELYLKKREKIIDNSKWNEKSPLVTIITPYYNQGSTINDTVQSVMSQSYRHFEYLIINDGSTNENTDILNSIKVDNRVKIINLKQNIGKGSPAAVRNYGISRAKGKYVVCLDGDDKIDPLYIEKCLIVLENDPSLGLVTCVAKTFGSSEEILPYCEYNAHNLLSDNMVKTSAMYKKEAWEVVGGYKEGIGYEDWEFWINLAENGYFGKLILEPLFFYMVAENSRYISDRKKHEHNINTIINLHPNYRREVKKHLKLQRNNKKVINPASAYVNLNKSKYLNIIAKKDKKNILIVIPWMTFGGAETLIVNFCKEIYPDFNIFYITGQKSDNEWEYKFKEISPYIYHIANYFTDKSHYTDFVDNFIKTRSIDVVHIIHSNLLFEGLETIKTKNPNVKIAITMFNDRVEQYFTPAISQNKFVDVYVSDNKLTADHFTKDLPDGAIVKAIPNGIDCYDIFNPALYNRKKQRIELGINDDDIAVFFVGRLSPEKNPDVFIDSAKTIIKTKKSKKIKFFMIGDGVMKTYVEKEISGINENVKYLGYQKDIAKYLSSADVFVLPSSVEGFPLSILEAMAMNLAVIASRVGAIPDVIDHKIDGFIVEPGNSSEIAKIIKDLDDNRKILNQIKESARSKVKKLYSNISLKNNYEKLYKDLMK